MMKCNLVVIFIYVIMLGVFVVIFYQTNTNKEMYEFNIYINKLEKENKALKNQLKNLQLNKVD